MASSSTPGTPDINDPLNLHERLAELKERAKWCYKVCSEAATDMDKVGGQLFQLDIVTDPQNH